MGNHFTVTVSSMETAGNEMQRVFGDLRASCTEISALRSGLSFHTAADYRIKKRLADEISRITQEADHTEKMKEPKFMAILTAQPVSYVREDGIYVISIFSLGP